MPSSLWPNFIDGAYTARSASIDNERLVNLIVETVDSEANPKRKYLIGAPGLVSETVTAQTGCRGFFAQDAQNFVVMGGTLYQVTVTGNGPAGTLAVSTTQRGTTGALGNDGAPVSFASNGQGGQQLAIVSNGALFIYNLNTNTLSAAISLPLTKAPGVVKFLNGYFLLNEIGTLKVWFSELEDGTTWNGLDFFTRSQTSDDVVGMEVLFDQIRVFGTQTSEVFYDNGDADNPFLPYPGTTVMSGGISRFGSAIVEESICYISQSVRQVIRAMQVGIGEPIVISTPAVEFAWASYGTYTDLECWSYNQEGHAYFVVMFPTVAKCWVWDARERSWHERVSWINATCSESRWRARGFANPTSGAGVVLCGDYLTGDIYWLNLDAFTENGALMTRRRRAPYLSAENQWLFLDQIELGTQPGVGISTDPGTQATVNMHLSRDGGNTYTPNVSASMGVTNNFQARTIWRKLGRARADRLVIDISMTDPVRVIWGPGLWLRAHPGAGAL